MRIAGWVGLWKHVVRAIAVSVGAALLLTGCAADAAQEAPALLAVEALSGPADAGFARAYEPVAFAFPDDHGAHSEYQTEWWYFTGNLADEVGEDFGYQLTFFRSALTPHMPERASDWATNQVYMAHFAVTDAAAGEHPDFERFSRGSAGLAGVSQDPAWGVWLEDWRVETMEPGVVAMSAADADEAGNDVRVDLLLRETREPVLHGNRGLSQKGPQAGNASYYYSLVGLDTTGQVTIGGRTVDVSGVSWMDHEYGTSALSEDAVGWDWFSAQLDNGAVLMLAQVRTEDGGRLPEFESTLVTPEGEQFAIGAGEFELETLDEWTSPATDVTYPSGWRITIPGRDLELTLTPLLRDQEMTGSYTYWEGAVDAAGQMGGEDVTGKGYVELTGYSGKATGNLR